MPGILFDKLLVEGYRLEEVDGYKTIRTIGRSKCVEFRLVFERVNDNTLLGLSDLMVDCARCGCPLMLAGMALDGILPMPFLSIRGNQEFLAHLRYLKPKRKV